MEILILSNEEQDRNLFISCLSADKSSFTFCPSEAKRGECSAALRRYQEAKPPLDTPRQAAGRIYFSNHFPLCLTNNSFFLSGSAIISSTIFSILIPCEPLIKIKSFSFVVSTILVFASSEVSNEKICSFGI